MTRSLANLIGVNPGFDPAKVLTLRLNSTPGARARDSLPLFYQTLIGRLRALPGVEDVALGDCPPLAGGCNGTVIWFRGRASAPSGAEPDVGVHWVTPDWFRTLRVPLLSGRVFTDADRLGGRKVVLVNAAAAHRFWPNESPIGRAIGVGQGGFDTAYVVGIVGDVRFQTIDSLPAADVYIPYAQSPRSGALAYIRTSGDPGAVAAPARRAIQEIGPDMPVYDVRTFSSRVADATTQARFSALLLAIFAAAALVLATVGIYGVISFAVAQRTREIGIRMALGAQRSDVLKMTVIQGLKLVGIGLFIGLVSAFILTRVMATLLFGISATDPLTFLSISLMLLAVAILASYIPALRATRVDPMIALRAQ
jgi:putative ABC transport system permease protein